MELMWPLLFATIANIDGNSSIPCVQNDGYDCLDRRKKLDLLILKVLLRWLVVQEIAKDARQ